MEEEEEEEVRFDGFCEGGELEGLKKLFISKGPRGWFGFAGEAIKFSTW